MNETLQIISLADLSIAFIPVLIAMVFLYLWSLNVKQASYALSRMLVQLLLIGYVLSYIFYSDNAGLIAVILLAMVSISCWIALRTLNEYRLVLFKHGFIAILCGGGFTLFVISQGALSITPWYQPQVIIPLAGMIFATAMNSISLSAERIFSEIDNKTPYALARKHATAGRCCAMLLSTIEDFMPYIASEKKLNEYSQRDGRDGSSTAVGELAD